MQSSFRLLTVASLGLVLSASAIAQRHQKKKIPASTPAVGAWLRGVTNGTTAVVDLTYAINDKSPSWPGDSEPFRAEVVASPETDGYFARRFCMLEHYGTHLDAPAHFPPGSLTVDQIPLERFFGPAVVIDVRRDVMQDPDYRLTLARVQKWEAAHGRIPQGAIVLMRTGWSSRWPNEVLYRSMDDNGVMHFPGFSMEAAKFIIARGASGLGIDTLSVDYGPSKKFEVHSVDLPAGLFNLENLANLDRLPESGAFLIIAPIKLQGGSGGPVRVFALMPPG
jgi:kynurenine formamidase